jgi:hypothetical protein
VARDIDAAAHPHAVVLLDVVEEALQRPEAPGAAEQAAVHADRLIIAGRSSPSAYITSKASRRYSKNSSPCEKPCGSAKRMSLVSRV